MQASPGNPMAAPDAFRRRAMHSQLKLIHFQVREGFQILRAHVGYRPEFEAIAVPVQNVEAVLGEAFRGCTLFSF